MNKTVHELLAFIKDPILGHDRNTGFGYRLKKAFSVLIICLATSFFFTILISIVEEFGFISTEKHAVENVFDTKGPVYFFLFAVIVAPLLEESIFRGPLTLFKKKKNFKIAFYFFAIAFGFLHISNYEISKSILLFSPLLIAPQIFAGCFFGFIRVKFGLLWSIAMHATYNAFLLSLFIIAKHAITQS